MLTPEHKLKIRNAVNLIQRMDDAFKELDCHLAVVDKPIYTRSWIIAEALIDELDVYGWMSWFILENDYGASALEAGYDGKLKPIKTVDDLLELMDQESNA